VDPAAYVEATLRAILDGHPMSRIDELMPWTFAPASTRAAEGVG
ncbi:MAG: transposase domain-containing protein, partial [Paracoccaceae bacterium]